MDADDAGTTRDGTPVDGAPGFAALGLPPPLLHALAAVGYESPSPIQAACIPPLLAGQDLLGQAQTGTGKTAAFALPILARLELAQRVPQALVLAPTRELAIQVAEAFQRYASALGGFQVLPIYGGQGYGPQLAALKRGVHVVVGTPGRVVDHLRRGSLDLASLRWLVLDEADEMLRMGFAEDVEAVLEKTPPTRQTALFSATMPPAIRRIAKAHLRDPAEITIAARTTTAANIRQRYWLASGVQKLDALTRILETESFEAMLVFARTRHATEELAEKLQARGFPAAAIHGEVQQSQREKTVQRLREGQLDLLVATDVAARGLDVDRISHVLNYDIPYDTESYVHRIGRTGRAGRKGEAILFVAPRERGMLRAIERATRQPIEPMALPSAEAVNESRVAKFADRITEVVASGEHLAHVPMLQQQVDSTGIDPVELAAALAHLLQGERPMLLPPDPPEHFSAARTPGSRHAPERGPKRPREHGSGERAGRSSDRGAGYGAQRDGDRSAERNAQRDSDRSAERGAERSSDRRAERSAERAAERARRGPAVEPGASVPQARHGSERDDRKQAARVPDTELDTYRVEVGASHGVKPSNLVGAIANEAGLDSRYIGRIDIREDHSLVDLPQGMPRELLQHLKKVWVSGRMLRMSRVAADEPNPHPRRPPQRPRRK